eukprot:GILJ01009316.1.p1 GENE.GILJ01009316.1~~GILJ01009316.1.p1  ORF type:complete len:496 (-),score=58.27 GILJ01009316.1:451-1938(-)
MAGRPRSRCWYHFLSNNACTLEKCPVLKWAGTSEPALEDMEYLRFSKVQARRAAKALLPEIANVPVDMRWTRLKEYLISQDTQSEQHWEALFAQEAMQGSLRVMTADIELLRQHEQELCDEVARIRAERDQSRMETDTLRQQLQAEKTECQLLQRRLTQAESNATRFETQLSEQRNALFEQSRRLHEQFDLRVENLCRDYETRLSQLQDSQSTIDLNYRPPQEYEQEIQLLKMKINDLQSQLNDQTAETYNALSQTDKLQEEVDRTYNQWKELYEQIERDRVAHEEALQFSTRREVAMVRTTREIALVQFLTTCLNFLSVSSNSREHFIPWLKKRRHLVPPRWTLPTAILEALNFYRLSHNPRSRSGGVASSYNQSDPMDFLVACGNTLRHWWAWKCSDGDYMTTVMEIIKAGPELLMMALKSWCVQEVIDSQDELEPRLASFRSIIRIFDYPGGLRQYFGLEERVAQYISRAGSVEVVGSDSECDEYHDDFYDD